MNIKRHGQTHYTYHSNFAVFVSYPFYLGLLSIPTLPDAYIFVLDMAYWLDFMYYYRVGCLFYNNAKAAKVSLINWHPDYTVFI